MLIREGGRRYQVSARTLIKAAAAEFAKLHVKQHHPTTARLLNERPLKLPRLHS